MTEERENGIRTLPELSVPEGLLARRMINIREKPWLRDLDLIIDAGYGVIEKLNERKRIVLTARENGADSSYDLLCDDDVVELRKGHHLTEHSASSVLNMLVVGCQVADTGVYANDLISGSGVLLTVTDTEYSRFVF